MRGGAVVLVVGAILLAAAAAHARGERELGRGELRAEASRNRALAEYMARNGLPEVAETHFLADQPPWDDHEVTLYYLRERKEIGFARAWILGRPDVQIIRYERVMTDDQVAALQQRSVMRDMGPTERAEEAARRAEAAATRVEVAAGTAEHAADRAEAIAGKMEGAFHRAVRK